MISIITVNWNAYDFLSLLIESLEINSSIEYELIVVDNSIVKQNITNKKVRQFMMASNIGHGPGLNYGVKLAQYDFVMFLDVDAHIICKNWHDSFLNMMNEYDVVGGKGVPVKPIRPSCMFMKKEFSKYDWMATKGYKGHRITPDGFDVAIQAYYQMQKDGVKIALLESVPNHYGTYTGEEFLIDGKPIIYHHWSGSWLQERQIDFPNIDLFKEKEKLFSKIKSI